MKQLIAKACLCCMLFPGLSKAGDTLTVENCRKWAVEASPLQERKKIAENILALQQNNLKSNDLPKIGINAQASWQSDVFGLPIESPLFSIPQVPKDQYKLTLDATERIWDGQMDKTLLIQKNLEKQLMIAQTNVDVFQLREIVTDLYFKILLIQESEKVLNNAIYDLENRLKQTLGAIEQGTSLRTAADQIRIQILKIQQQLDALLYDKKALLEMLSIWIGKPLNNPILDIPYPLNPDNILNWQTDFQRPEFVLFETQERNLLITKDLLKIKTKPRLDAFLQSGLGNPNPFNFFETGFQPFLLIGLKASWVPFDWGNNKRDQQILSIQAKQFSIQKNAFQQRLQIQLLREAEGLQKWRQQLQTDDQIIRLQEDILNRADAQVKNGVMTMTDYLTQVNILTQARLTRKTHEIQSIQARELFRAATEN